MDNLTLLKNIVSRFVAGQAGAGSADIVFSSDNGKNTIILPVVPADLPEFSVPQNNSTFSGVLADMSVIGTLGLRSTSFEFFAPVNPSKYPFAKPTGSGAIEILGFFDRVQREKIPARLVIVYTNGATYINMPCLVTFTYRVDRVGDYHFKVDLLEYPMYSSNTGGIVF
ncbi:MAG: hypothetical protein II195_03525 [Selenomonadales bacterium]|nr:hypothetical protein [Selenomonadales bacterium]